MRSTATTRSLICATHRPVTHSRICRPTKFIALFRKYPDFTERYMKRPTGSPPLYLASSVTETTPVVNSEQRLHSVLATLEECRAALIDSSVRETGQLVSVAILDLRMKLNRIADSELKALCDAMLPNETPAERSEESKSPHGPPRRALLKLGKSQGGSRNHCIGKRPNPARRRPIRGVAIAARPGCRNAALLIEKIHHHRRFDCT